MKEPKYLVQTKDKMLYAYYSKNILLCDLTLNQDKNVTIYRLKPAFAKIVYEPVTKEDLIQELYNES